MRHRHPCQRAFLTLAAALLASACRSPVPATPAVALSAASTAPTSLSPTLAAVPATAAATTTTTESTHMPTANAPIDVDVYADLVCPWCFVGTERLNQAIANTGLGARVRVRHHAFLLNPDTPPEGTNIPKMLREKYGRDPEQIFATVHQAARDTGIALDLHKQPVSYPTWQSHALLRHAESKGTQLALKHAIFWANFIDGRNIADTAVLVELATPHGFTADEVQRIVTDPAERELTLQDDHTAHQLGITGVPFFVVSGAGTTAGKRAVSGAQPVAVLERLLREGAGTP